MAKTPVKRGPGRPKKLDTNHAISIKRSLKTGARLVHLAAEYKVSVSTLRRHVPDYASYMRAA